MAQPFYSRYANRQSANERNKGVKLEFSDGSAQSVTLNADADMGYATLHFHVVPCTIFSPSGAT